MKSIISIFILMGSFSFYNAQAADSCAALIGGNDGKSWSITYPGTRDAISLKCDFNQNKKCENAEYMPPMPAVSCAIHSDQRLAMRYMLEAKADINARDNGGLTPLMHAAWSTEGIYTQTLIDRGADLNAKDNQGKDAVDYARLRHNVKAEAELVKENFDKKNPCDYSYKNLCDYFFVAQAETGINPDVAAADPRYIKNLGRAIMAGISSGQSKKKWSSFIEKAKPYTSESYYDASCSAFQAKSSGGANKAKAVKAAR